MLVNAIQRIEGSTKKITKHNIKKTGKYPVVTQERDVIISGYSDEKDPVADLPVILFGDHSCSLKYLDFAFFRGADGTVLLKPNKDFIPKYFYYILQYAVSIRIENKDNYERHYKYLQNLYLPLPPRPIQEKIIAEIEAVEKEETAAKKKIENLIKNMGLHQYVWANLSPSWKRQVNA